MTFLQPNQLSTQSFKCTIQCILNPILLAHNKPLKHNNYLDGVSPGAVTSSHIAVALGHGGADCQVAVLTVHVVGSGPRVVSKPDAEVLDFEWLAFNDGLNADNLSGGLLELTELTEEIPEP